MSFRKQLEVKKSSNLPLAYYLNNPTYKHNFILFRNEFLQIFPDKEIYGNRDAILKIAASKRIKILLDNRPDIKEFINVNGWFNNSEKHISNEQKKQNALKIAETFFRTDVEVYLLAKDYYKDFITAVRELSCDRTNQQDVDIQAYD